MASALIFGLANDALAALPDGRAYELVTPGATRIGDAWQLPAIDADGDGAAYGATTGLPDAQLNGTTSYAVARRGDGGWTSTDADLPASHWAGFLSSYFPMQFSPRLDEGIFSAQVPENPDDQDNGSADFYRRDLPEGPIEWLTAPPTLPDTAFVLPAYAGASTDLKRVVFSVSALMVPGGPSQGVYLRDDAGTHLLSELPDGSPATTPQAPAANTVRFFPYRAASVVVAHGGIHEVSDSGTRAFFIDSVSSLGPLYLRDGDRTVLVSASQRAGDSGAAGDAYFLGASHDGDVAYFESADQLTDDAPIGGGIYRYDLGADSLQLLTPDANNPAGLDFSTSGGSSATLSDDASHIYFTTSAALTADAPSVDPSVNDNLYVWDGSGTRYIATLDRTASNGTTGIVARTSRDGRYAIIVSSASLNGAPVNGHRALYLYDDTTHNLACISCRADGAQNQANASLDAEGVVSWATVPARNITDDGRVFFQTADHLLPADVGGGSDIYEYDHGKLSLITPGTSDSDAYLADNTDDGRDVFFLSRQRLVSGDADIDQLDVYDARVGGGFAEPSAPSPCQGDDCQDPAMSPPSLPEPASARASGRGNAQPAPAVKAPRRSLRLRRLTPAQRSQLARTGRVLVAVTVTGGGSVTIRARGQLHGHRLTLGGGHRTIRIRAKLLVHVAVRLKGEARRELARLGRLRVAIVAQLSGVRGTSQQSIMLTVAHRP